jgi:hypothetical protein
VNQILASIYETGGFEKTASPYTGKPLTLHDLALSIVGESLEEGADLTKIASEANKVWEQLIEADRAGRAMAHIEYGEMEKAAFDGKTEALDAFYSDVQPASEKAQLKQAALQELARRYA